MEKLLFTSESVTEGHPDKMCDQISDAILDALLEKDPMSRVACETCTTTGLVMVMGEITTNAYVDIQKIVRDTVREIGYTRGKYGFDAETCGVITTLDEQSADIALGVDKALEAKENKMSDDEIEAIGAGDQGMMFGYATDETEEYMPYPIAMAHKLALQLTKVRKDGTLPYLRPDGKTQVTVEYDENGVPRRLDAVVLSTQHDPEVTQEQIHADIKKHVFDVIIPAGKSSLENALTGAGILEDAMLFSTLDTTTRALELEGKQQVLLTDTVGFIRKLPHHLIEAFKSTLEEAKYADIIIHVVDASNPQMDTQMYVVYDTLRQLGVEGKPVITLFNKQDKLESPQMFRDLHADYTFAVSAKTGQGLDELKGALLDIIRQDQIYVERLYDFSEAGKIQLIRKHGQLLEEEYVAEGIAVKAYVSKEIYGKI